MPTLGVEDSAKLGNWKIEIWQEGLVRALS